MKPQNLELLQDRFQSRLDKLTPEQAEAGAQAVQTGATLATLSTGPCLDCVYGSWPTATAGNLQRRDDAARD